MPVRSARSREYWGKIPDFDPRFAAAALERFGAHSSDLIESKRHARMFRMWCMYFSLNRDGGWDDTEVQSAGPNGETTLIRPNEMRNLIQHQLNLVTQTPPGFDVVAVNNDAESFAQAQLGNGILDYYMRVHHLDDLRVERAEIAVLLGESFLHGRWDPGAGKEYAVRDEPVLDENGEPVLEDVPVEESVTEPEPGESPMHEATEGAAEQMAEGESPMGGMAANDNAVAPAQPQKRPKTRQVPVHEGEFVFRVNTPYDVCYDPMSPDKNRPRWKIIREPVNRFDLAAQYPEYEERILDAEPYSKCLADEVKFLKAQYEHDDYVAIYYVYFEKSPALPDGREAIVLDDRTVLTDGPLSEDRIPDFRLAPCNIIFRTGGYTNNFDLMALQEVFSAQMSTILSNHTAFGKQFVTSPKGSNIKPQHISRGLSLIEYDAIDGRPPPQALSLLAPQEELITFAELIRALMGSYAVIPPPMRGESTKGDSGSKEALIHSAAQQFASGFHRNLSRSDEDLASHLLTSLRVHATAPRVATIVGKGNNYASEEFTGDDLKQISRVSVRTSSAMRDTPQGREMLADKLMTFPDGIVTAEQYITFLDSGRVDPMYEGTRAELMLIRRENEALREGGEQPIIVAKTDKHALHYQEHKCLLADIDIRRDPDKVKFIEDHMAGHAMALTPTMPDGTPNPGFAGLPALLMTGQKPLPAPQPAPGSPGIDEPEKREGGPPHPPERKGPPDTQGGPGPANDNGKPPMPRQPVNPVSGQRVQAPVPKAPPVTQM